MIVKRRELGELGANCYMLLSNNAAVVIDPGCYSREVADFLKENSDKQRLILLTHGHFDHIGGAERLREETQTDIAICEKETSALSDPFVNLSAMFGIPAISFSANKTFNDGEKIIVGDIEFSVIATPGHTVGGCCFLVENTLFSGDILFKRSIGRTDFPGGSSSEMMRSLQAVLKLDGNIKVLSGHGDETTIKEERINNPFIRGII